MKVARASAPWCIRTSWWGLPSQEMPRADFGPASRGFCPTVRFQEHHRRPNKGTSLAIAESTAAEPGVWSSHARLGALASVARQVDAEKLPELKAKSLVVVLTDDGDATARVEVDGQGSTGSRISRSTMVESPAGSAVQYKIAKDADVTVIDVAMNLGQGQPRLPKGGLTDRRNHEDHRGRPAQDPGTI